MQYTSTLTRVATTGPLQYISQAGARAAPLVRPVPAVLNAEQNRHQVLRMYRKIVRSVPRILLAYEITGGPTLERDVIGNVRHYFERNKDVTDMGVASVLRHKAEMEVQESLLMWKTKSHVCNLIMVDAPPISALMAKQQQDKQLPQQAKESPFLSSFYQG